MIGRLVRDGIVLHVLFIGTWVILSGHTQAVFERWVTLIAMLTAGVYYVGMAFAFLWARKSRLNLSFSIQKVYWSFLVWVLAVPVQAGLIVHHAPYSSNPYALWGTPGWLRTYIWVFMAVATMAVSREFFRANDLHPSRWRPWHHNEGD